MSAEDKDVAARVAELARLKIMDTERDPVLDEIVMRAAEIVDSPISLISLVDDKRQWFKASFGLPRGGSPIEASFCAKVILQEEALIVLDAKSDPRFKDNPFVTDDPFIRFYLGVPLIGSNNTRLGALCIIDQTPHQAAARETILRLRELAREAVEQIEGHYPKA